jgi:hypothetical protein
MLMLILVSAGGRIGWRSPPMYRTPTSHQDGS